MEAGKTVIAAFRMSIQTRPVNPWELIFHYDRGIQNACEEFRKLLKDYKIHRNMSRKGNCWDNAVTENFFKIIKSELIYHIPELTSCQTQMEIFEFIEIRYNRKKETLLPKFPNARTVREKTSNHYHIEKQKLEILSGILKENPRENLSSPRQATLKPIHNRA